MIFLPRCDATNETANVSTNTEIKTLIYVTGRHYSDNA